MERSEGQLLLDLLSDRPIAYHPELARAFGSVDVAVFLGQLLYWTGREADPDGWIWKSRAEWTAETALSAKEQRRARGVLRAQGVLLENQRGYNRTLGYRVDQEKLLQVLAIVPNGSMHGAETHNRRGPKAQCMGPKGSLHDHRLPHEITSETTREGRARAKRPPPSPPKPKKTEKPPRRRKRDLDALCAALAEVTAMDPLVEHNREELELAAAGLYDAGRRAEHVRKFYWWWCQFDWRGKKGERPTIDHVQEGIALPEAPAPPAAPPAGMIDPDDPKYQRGGKLGHLFERRCEAPRPGPILDSCMLPAGHAGPHRGAGEMTWTDQEECDGPDGDGAAPAGDGHGPRGCGDEQRAGEDGRQAAGREGDSCSS